MTSYNGFPRKVILTDFINILSSSLLLYNTLFDKRSVFRNSPRKQRSVLFRLTTRPVEQWAADIEGLPIDLTRYISARAATLSSRSAFD